MDKPFNYFLALCMGYSQELKEAPDWNKNTELSEFYGVEGGVMVTEDDEFLSNSPLLVKKAIDALLVERQKPAKKYLKKDEIKDGPQFSGDTYTKYGKVYLRPKESSQWQDSDVTDRLDHGPEYWQNEKRKFIEMAKEGRVNLKGLKWLVTAGFLTTEDVKGVDPLGDL